MEHATSLIQIGKLTADLGTRIAHIEGQRLNLTPREFGILELLLMNSGKLVTRHMFLEHIYTGLIEKPDYKVIDVFVCTLRKKMAERTNNCYIQTVWGRGYTLSNPCLRGSEGTLHRLDGGGTRGCTTAKF